jgi:hypothetical protein
MPQDPGQPQTAPSGSVLLPAQGGSAVAVAAAGAGIERFRVFSPDAEKLAQDWALPPAEAPIAWTMDPNMAFRPGVEGGFWVAAPPHRGYAKPKNPHRSDPHTYPVAGVEKIASDLAYQAKFPVPPVTLFQRANAPAGEPKHHSVSAPPFSQVMTWGHAKADVAVFKVVQPLAWPLMSAMIAFDTWLECADHQGHPDNLLLTTTAGVGPVKANFAFIDYTYSMIHHWRKSSFRNGNVAPIYDPGAPVDVRIIDEAITAISGIGDAMIQSIVGGIPDPFMLGRDKAEIIDGLIYRRDNLRRIIAAKHPGV